ncbi:hypothetical protein [[Mycobacterium] burgundiense]|jgi:hypothetical protein|uniref:Transmembrane protein n=1 Tax=[Mycobacterium] burgundiense TaxID=3064286 RepID=A0ABM9M7P6_9MYCO|nr:hypothetical protein [Mycolicibacterium sp. MU0053]CAJ1511244.1 hypothetical protein MU0053_005161 [Mycolicibacterium sp. MU0053]
MLIAGVLCLCAAVLSAGFGLWTLTRPAGEDVSQQVRRAVAPTQLAAAVMLAAGAAVALAGLGSTAVVVLIVCVLGAVGTVAAGSWQGARFAVAHAATSPPPSDDCAGSCAACTLSCS